MAARDFWYETYYNQNWYPNTFLVRKPDQIAHTRKKGEWNSIAKVGCNLVCLAMILGIDPAHLAGALARHRRLFTPDPRYPARRLDGSRALLVWDHNRPNADLRRLTLRGLWHPQHGQSSVRIHYVKSHFPESLEEATKILARIHRQGRHAVWGPEKHAYLVAGRKRSGYVLWDPDAKGRELDATVAGGITLASRFPRRGQSEIYEYEVRWGV